MASLNKYKPLAKECRKSFCFFQHWTDRADDKLMPDINNSKTNQHSDIVIN